MRSASVNAWFHILWLTLLRNQY